MIQSAFITEWRNKAPWPQSVQIEQDLIISRALVEIYRNPAAQSVAFRGGTALYKLHLAPPARYSEDIDLVQVDAGPIGGVLDVIRGALDGWLGKPKHTRNEGRVTMVYRVPAEDDAGTPIRLKVEINSREHFSVLGMEERTFEVSSRWFSGSASVRTYPLDELLGTKLRALYQRKKGRDLFDLWYASHHATVNYQKVVDCFVRYLSHGGLQVTRAQMEKNLHSKLKDRQFAADVGPLLAPGIDWDVRAAGDRVLHEFVARLPGEPWKGDSDQAG